MNKDASMSLIPLKKNKKENITTSLRVSLTTSVSNYKRGETKRTYRVIEGPPTSLPLCVLCVVCMSVVCMRVCVCVCSFPFLLSHHGEEGTQVSLYVDEKQHDATVRKNPFCFFAPRPPYSLKRLACVNTPSVSQSAGGAGGGGFPGF